MHLYTANTKGSGSLRVAHRALIAVHQRVVSCTPESGVLYTREWCPVHQRVVSCTPESGVLMGFGAGHPRHILLMPCPPIVLFRFDLQEKFIVPLFVVMDTMVTMISECGGCMVVVPQPVRSVDSPYSMYIQGWRTMLNLRVNDESTPGVSEDEGSRDE